MQQSSKSKSRINEFDQKMNSKDLKFNDRSGDINQITLTDSAEVTPTN